LAGVGGKTVAEAKANVSVPEFTAWLTYRRRYGPICPNRRADTLNAHLMHLMAALNGNKSEVSKFLVLQDDSQRVLSMEEALTNWS